MPPMRTMRVRRRQARSASTSASGGPRTRSASAANMPDDAARMWPAQAWRAERSAAQADDADLLSVAPQLPGDDVEPGVLQAGDVPFDLGGHRPVLELQGDDETAQVFAQERDGAVERG